MRHFHIRSIVLGIGIGIILTSIVGLIYGAGITPSMSKDEIIQKSREYGMVSKDEYVSANESTQEPSLESTTEAAAKAEQTTGPSKTQESTDTNETPQPTGTVVDTGTKNQNTVATPTPIAVQPTPTPDNKPKVREVAFRIKPGQTTAQIAAGLKKEGLISNTYMFVREMQSRKLTTKVVSGWYKFRSDYSIDQIISIITRRR